MPASDDGGNGSVEQWFVERGVPHFIDGYAAPTDIWTRALPVLLVAYLAGGFHALDLAGWSAARNVWAAVVVLVVLSVGWAATNVARRRSWRRRPDVVGTPELALFVVGPAIPSVLFGQWADATQAVGEGLLVLGVIYVVTSYGLIPLAIWAARRSIAQIGALGRMVARGLPLLLLFTTFLFVNADVWQMAGGLVGFGYWATLGIFIALGMVFVLSRVPDLTRGLGSFADWSEVRTLLAGTPADSFALPDAGRPPELPLGRRQRMNVALVSVFSQALQITAVAVLLTLFFVLFGVLAITEQTTAIWTQLDDVRVIASLRVGDRRLVLTEPLLRVAGFLGAFSGMYFTVVLATDATYRDAFTDDVGPQIRQAFAVRAAASWRAVAA